MARASPDDLCGCPGKDLPLVTPSPPLKRLDVRAAHSAAIQTGSLDHAIDQNSSAGLECYSLVAECRERERGPQTSVGTAPSRPGLFERDRRQFERVFIERRIQKIEVKMPFRYLVSGGVSLRPLAPAWSFGFWRGFENALRPRMRSWAMVALIVLRRV